MADERKVVTVATDVLLSGRAVRVLQGHTADTLADRLLTLKGKTLQAQIVDGMRKENGRVLDSEGKPVASFTDVLQAIENSPSVINPDFDWWSGLIDASALAVPGDVFRGEAVGARLINSWGEPGFAYTAASPNGPDPESGPTEPDKRKKSER